MRSLHALLSVFALTSLVAGHVATPHRRAIDTCANVALPINLGILSVDIRVCACLGTSDALTKENSSLYAASKKLGEADVKSRLTAAIQGSQDKRMCTYPDYAIPACSSNSLCNFNCPADRVKVGGRCVCRGGYRECNGKCISMYQACSSQGPKPPTYGYGRRSIHQISSEKNKRNKHGTPNWTRRSLSSAHCPTGTEMCGVPGRPDAWECLNVEEDLESCGGCAFPFFPDQEPGVDCSAIPGVEVVACRKGLCEVSECAANWTITTDGHACELNEHAKNRKFISVGRAPKEDLSAGPIRMTM